MRIRWMPGIIMALAVAARAQMAAPDLDAEISRLRRELAQTRNERERNNQDFAKDRTAHEEYLKGAAQRRAQSRATGDSLRQAIVAAQRRADSLGALVEQARASQKQIELSQERLRGQLLAAIRLAGARARRMPPTVVRQLAGPISLLEAELASKSVSSEEALNRMYQVVVQMEEATGGIQVLQETSPVPEIRGTVYRLRVGAFFEAVADVRGERCVVWDGYDANGAARWREETGAVAAAVLKAANVREGKALPALVALPLVSGRAAEDDR